eukprot:1688287-Lingulodinium_polyedra.AAC.1
MGWRSSSGFSLRYDSFRSGSSSFSKGPGSLVSSRGRSRLVVVAIECGLQVSTKAPETMDEDRL